MTSELHWVGDQLVMTGSYRGASGTRCVRTLGTDLKADSYAIVRTEGDRPDPLQPFVTYPSTRRRPVD